MAGVLTAESTEREIAPGTRRPGGRKAWWVTCLLVLVLAQFPLLRDPWALYKDDAANQILPTWNHLGHLVRDGHWPPLLDPGTWMGGNLAVEALFGVWNPVNALLWVGVSFVPNLFVAGVLVRMVAFLAIAIGTHGLCREYGAAPWASSALAVTIPFCGSLFAFDALKWPAALVAFAWIPSLWWVARRAAWGRTNVFWVFVLGALGVTSGNPYAMLGVVLVLTGVLVETALLRQWGSALRMFLVSGAVACIVPLVYLPLLLTSSVTWRESTLGNSGTLKPGAGDLLGASLPSYIPNVSDVGYSAVYFCWFALPLLPWLRWSVLRERWRELGACLVVGAFLLLAVGPSELWMFRWPLRVLQYGYLAAAVPLAVLLSAGLRHDQLRRRAWGSAGLLALSFYLAWSLTPEPAPLKRHVVSVVLLGGLTALAVWAYRRGGALRFAAVLQVGTVLAFGVQVFWFLGGHASLSNLFPTSTVQARAHFEHRYQGRVLQIGDPGKETAPGGPVWHDLLSGDLYRIAGIESVNSYTGMGFAQLSNALCMNYSGTTCPQAYRALWSAPDGESAPLADLMALDTVVVQRETVDQPQIPPGWRVSERDARITVLQRENPPARPGRVSWTDPGVRIASDNNENQRELVRFEHGGGQVMFARLAWPGYTARVNGAPVPVEKGPAGLLRVKLPPGVDKGRLDVSWQPPGIKVGLSCVVLGSIGALVLAFVQQRKRSKAKRPGVRS